MRLVHKMRIDLLALLMNALSGGGRRTLPESVVGLGRWCKGRVTRRIDIERDIEALRLGEGVPHELARRIEGLSLSECE